MNEGEATPAAIIRQLRSRPGRGGVRLTYRQADVALRLIEAGVRAVARERGLLVPIGPADLEGDGDVDVVELTAAELDRRRTDSVVSRPPRLDEQSHLRPADPAFDSGSSAALSTLRGDRAGTA